MAQCSTCGKEFIYHNSEMGLYCSQKCQNLGKERDILKSKIKMLQKKVELIDIKIDRKNSKIIQIKDFRELVKKHNWLTREWINNLPQLDERDKYLIGYILEGRTLEQCSGEFGYSQSRTRSIFLKAMKKIKKEIKLSKNT